MKGKYIVPLILASVSATTFGAHAQFSVNADYSESTKLEGDLISVSRFQGEGEVNEPVYLPEATSSSGEDVSIVVIDPRGNKITPSVDTSSKKYFVPTLKGYYTVKYTSTANNNLETVSEELKVLISGSEYSITLPKNNANVIPAVIKTGTEIKIPLPAVNEDDEEIAEAEVISGLEVTVTNKDDATSTQPLTYNQTSKTYNFTAPKAGVYEIVYRYRKGNYVQDYKTDSFVVKDNFDSSKINLNFSYKSTKPSTAVLGVEQKLPEVKVFDKNNSSVELDAFVDITVKHMESGKVYTVKDYKFTPAEKGDYKVTYKASIPLFGLETQESTFIIKDVKDNKNPELTVTNNYEKSTVNGKTTITKVYDDANKNNTADSGEVLYDAANYTTADEEEKEEAIKKALGSNLYNIPSVVVLNSEGKATIDVPAFYGSDNFDDQSKLTYSRYIKNDSGLMTEIKKANPDGTREKYPENEWAQHTFTAPGEYYIRYSVEDEAGNYYQDSYPITVLSSNTTLLEASEYMLPTLEFPAISSYVKTNGTLLINQPSATDKHDDRVETRVYYSFEKDFSIATAKEVTELNDDGQFELKIADAIAALNPTSPTKIYVHAVAYNDYAIKTESDSSTTRLYSKLTREVTLINSTETDKPEFVTATAGTFIDDLADENNITDGIDNYGMNAVSGKPAFKQKDLVKLPAFVITDISDTNLNISLTVRDPYGKVITVKNSSYEKEVTFNGAGDVTLNTYTVQGGSFVVDYSGVYTITYTAKDASGNLTSKTYGVRVQDTEKPNIILSSYAPFTSSVEVGKFIEIPAATLKDKGEILTEVTTNVSPDNKKSDPSNPGKYVPGTYWRLIEGPSHNVQGTVGFTPTIAGEYVIEYYGWDAEGNETKSKRYTITAADTIKPTISLEKDYILNDVAWDEEKNQVTVYAPGVVELYDGYRDAKNPENDYDQTPVSDITLTVKVYDKNNNEIDSVVATEYEIDNQGNPVLTGGGAKKYFVIGNDGVNDVYAKRYRFIAQKQGTYTIKYIATDANGKSEEITRTVNVGDTKAPEVEWNDSQEDLITTANIGDYYEFNVDMITLDGIKTSDAIKKPNTADDADYKITVNMYDPTSSIVSNEYKNDESKENSYRWKFEKSGTYELRVVVEDKAGNKDTKSYNIVVAENETETETVKPVVGTILIVISSLLLVGVVAYFVVTSQIKNKGKKGPKAKSKK